MLRASTRVFKKNFAFADIESQCSVQQIITKSRAAMLDSIIMEFSRSDICEQIVVRLILIAACHSTVVPRPAMMHCFLDA